MKTILFDFDGVFNTYKSGWQGDAEIPDPPVNIDQMIEELRELSFGYQYRVGIFSTRCSTLEGKTAIWKWLERYNLDIYIDFITNEKVPAIVYIDDRAITFNGEWKGISDKINNFENWVEKNK